MGPGSDAGAAAPYNGSSAALTPMDVAALLAVRGKTGSSADGAATHHPLVCHLLDTAAVAERLWDEVVPEAVRARIANGLGLDLVAARAWAVALAAFHDLGKCSPAFQLGTLPDPTALFGPALVTAGLSRPADFVPARNGGARHGEVVADAGLDDLVDLLQVPRRVAAQLATLLGGHHGVFPPDGAICDRSSLGGPVWTEARRLHLSVVADLFGLESFPAPPRGPSRPAAMLLAGLITVADWVASNVDVFPLAGGAAPLTALDLPDYLERSRARSAVALRRLGWAGYRDEARVVPFGALFGVEEPRPVQAAALKLAEELRPPALAVLEVPTGEGKTEAALWLADRWSAARGVRGAYVALPTQTTSDQMFGRVRDMVRRRYPGEVAELHLLHGHAALSADFARLRDAADRLHYQPDAVYGDPMPDGASATVVASQWFTGAKRGLLAPLGVGTIDQALLAALVTPHVFVRLFGLAGKTLVVDEVHAADVYMATLLEQLLEWCAALGSPVVLLSATLPDARRRRFLAAYARGAGWPDEPATFPAASYPRVSWVSAAGSGARSVETSAPNVRSLGVSFVGSDVSALVAEVEALTADGGCVAVVCNTVGRAQDVYQGLAARLPGAASDDGPLVDLLHARFTLDERAAREARTLRRFGRVAAGANPQRPTRAVLVATQVIEQSLDLDFDAMVSEFAPADLLLQRAGRLHRHAANASSRPAALASPIVRVTAPALDAGGLPIFEPGARAVYDGHFLLRTWLALRGRDRIAVPGDVEALIETVYAAGEPPSDLDAVFAAAWRQSAAQLAGELAADRREAEIRRVRPPREAGGSLADLTRNALEEDAEHPALRAMTRLDADRVTIVCLEAPLVDETRRPSIGEAKALLGRSVPVSTRGLVVALRRIAAPAGWTRSPLLRGCVPFVRANQGVTVGAYRLVLDDRLGLIIERARNPGRE
ncbi:MAG: CRISPR-associated helicase Cas3' [Solirubrobacterales bacterium]